MNRGNARPRIRHHKRQGLIETDPTVTWIGKSTHEVSVLALKFYSTLANSQINIVYTPYAMSSNLSLLRSVAADVTSNQICKGMHLSGTVTKDMMNQGHKTILDGFNEVLPLVLAPRGDVNKPAFLFRTKMIVPQRFRPLRPEFIELARNNYHCDVEYVDLTNLHELENLNTRVSQETNQTVQTVLFPGDFERNNNRIGIVLVSYLYFQGLWEGHNSFRPENTTQQLFQPFGGNGVMVDFMRHRRMYCSYCSSYNLRAICCALYFEGGRYAMMIYRPRVGANYHKSIKDLEQTHMKNNSLDTIAAQFVRYHKRSRRGDGGFLVDVLMPKFTIREDLNMTPILSTTLGIQRVFDPNTAQLHGMREERGGSENPFISHVFHQVHVQVNENASPVDPNIPVYPPPRAASECRVKIKRLILNQPFLFSIFDYQNNVNVITGTVNNPTQPVPVLIRR